MTGTSPPAPLPVTEQSNERVLLGENQGYRFDPAHPIYTAQKGRASVRVYEGTTSTHETVIIKQVSGQAALLADSFTREEQTLKELAQHSEFNSLFGNGVLDQIEQGEDHYLVLRYMPGTSLARIKFQELPADQMLSMVYRIFHVVEVMQQTAFQHGDIHPGNLLLNAGSVIPIDFGSARGKKEPSYNSIYQSWVYSFHKKPATTADYDLYTASNSHGKLYFDEGMPKLLLYNSNTEWFAAIKTAQTLLRAYYQQNKNQQVGNLIDALEKELGKIISAQKNLLRAHDDSVQPDESCFYDAMNVVKVLIESLPTASLDAKVLLMSNEMLLASIDTTLSLISAQRAEKPQPELVLAQSRLDTLRQEVADHNQELKTLKRGESTAKLHQQHQQTFSSLERQIKPHLSKERSGIMAILVKLLEKFKQMVLGQKPGDSCQSQGAPAATSKSIGQPS